ncbi:MAG: hypothetical protein ACR2HO_12595 [Rubrobacteraceae bacterium]|nr:hypothetical protein [Actinomycetota bacterium]
MRKEDGLARSELLTSEPLCLNREKTEQTAAHRRPKTALFFLGIVDLGDLLIAAELFFAVALVALYLHLGDRDGRLGRIGGLLAYLAVALSAANAPYSLFFAEKAPQTPFPFNITILTASLAIFLGLMLLGIVTSRAGILSAHWRILPLMIRLLALLPVWILALVYVELPVVVLGFAWVLLGYLLWAEADASTRQRSRVN